VAGTGLESYPAAGFCISSSANGELISVTDIREIHCEDGRWMEVAQGCVQRQALVLAVVE
jgi:hypothetical protein